jgi:hypothetical protein
VEQKKTQKPNDVLAKQQKEGRKKDLNLKLNQGTKKRPRGDQDLQISSATTFKNTKGNAKCRW